MNKDWRRYLETHKCGLHIGQKIMGSGYSFGEGIVVEDIDVLDSSEIEKRLKPFWKTGIIFSCLIQWNTCNMVFLQFVFSLCNIKAKKMKCELK